MSLPVAILAGGKATRLGPIAARMPKSLVEVAGRPFAEHQIALLARHGLTDIVFLAGHLGTTLRDALGDGARWGVALRYAFDGARPLGTGGAIRAARAMLGERFFVLYGDSYLECEYERIEQSFLESGCAGLMTVYRNDGRWDRSNVQFDGRRILAYDKRVQEPQEASMRHIDYGLGLLTRSAFEAYPEHEPFDLATVYQDLLARGDLAAYEVSTRFYEIGSPAGLQEADAYLASKGTTAR